MAGGTNNGRRPARYSYWRVGNGLPAPHVLPFYIEQAGEYHCKPRYVTGSLDHPDITQIYYHLEGEATFEQPGERPICLAPGNLLIIPPHQTVYYRSPNGMKYHWLSLGAYWPSVWGTRPSVRLLPYAYDRELEARFAEIREVLILRQAGFPLKAVGIFYELMARLEELSPSQSVSESAYPEAMRNAISYLREKAADPFDAGETAAAVSLSQSHLRALFEKWLGESPRQFHTRCRVEEAMRLLQEQELPVTAVALAVGFHDVRHFSRVFKRVVGLRPSEYAGLGK
jgi:AraC-like DNA-binding protein